MNERPTKNYSAIYNNYLYENKNTDLCDAKMEIEQKNKVCSGGKIKNKITLNFHHHNGWQVIQV